MKSGAKRFPPPLHISIPLLVFGFSACFLCITGYQLYGRMQKREAERQAGIAMDQADRLAKAITRPTTSEAGGFQEELTWLVGDQWLHWGAVCTPEGTILHSAEKEQIGKSLQSVSEDYEKGLLMAVADKTPHKLIPGSIAVAIRPVLDPLTHEVQQVIVVRRDLTAPLERERALSISDTFYAGLVLLLSCTGFWLTLHWFLARRVRRLLVNIKGPELFKGPPLEGRDEFAEIARAFWESESRLRQITENVSNVFYMVSATSQQLLYVSPAYERVFGMKSADLLAGSYSWLDNIFEEDRKGVLYLHEPLFSGEEMVKKEYRIRHPNGKVRWLETKAFPVKDVHGVVYRVAGSTEDITERKEMEQAILDISERERRSIGHDLHDDLCQRLAAIKLRCEMMAHLLQQKQAVPPENVNAVAAQVGDAATLCRNIARGLSPVDLEGDGLMHALMELVQIAKTLYKVIYYFECPEPVLMGDNTTATHLYRIAQELVNNATRHAKPTRVLVRLTKEGHFVRLEVSNDGDVFNEPLFIHQGMGLRIIRYRANAIGANVTYEKRENGQSGTSAVCLVPVSACNLL